MSASAQEWQASDELTEEEIQLRFGKDIAEVQRILSELQHKKLDRDK